LFAIVVIVDGPRSHLGFGKQRPFEPEVSEEGYPKQDRKEEKKFGGNDFHNENKDL